MKLTTILFSIFYFSNVLATDHIMVQAGKNFIGNVSDGELNNLKNKRGKFRTAKVKEKVVKTISIKQGDSIIFLNKDDTDHNVFGKGFNLTQQKNIAKDKITFKEKGKQVVRCAIHPKMKLEVNVE